ncbi:transposase [Chitinispirillum alkaliphilum]|nr:transposase [Chitinispirillum alkaliphilum]
MLLKTILNRIQHYKGFIYKSVQIDQSIGRDRIIINIEPRKNSRATCSKCCKKSPGYDRLPERLFMFVPMWNIPVLFRYRPRRVNCNVHGVVVEHLPWAKGKSSLCNAFRIFLSQWARLISWSQVADRFGVSWDSIFESIKYVVDHDLEKRDLSAVQAIGVDEIAIKSGHKYATVVYQIDAGCRRLLWIGKDRKAKRFCAFFTILGKNVLNE